MNVSLTPHLDTYVRTLVDGGRYASASEVVRAGIRLLKEAEERAAHRAELQALLQEGLEGPAVSMTSDDLRSMIREHANLRRTESALLDGSDFAGA